MVFLLSACAGNVTSTATESPATKAPATKTPPTKSPPTAIVNPPDCTDSAAFVADVTVPDNTNLKQGETFNKVWRVKNTGTCTWTDQYTLTFYDGDQMGAPESLPLGVTKPGDTLDIAVDMTAPDKDAIYRADFEMHNSTGIAMKIDQNTKLWVVVTVGGTTSGSSSSTASRTGTGSSSGSSSSSSAGSTNTSNATSPGLATSTCAFTIDQSKVNDTVAAINAYRAQNGLPPYTVNPDLVTAAQAHAADMACHNLFVHTGSNGSTPTSRVASTGYVASAVTENVYGSYPPLTGQGVMDWWKNDLTDIRHNQNLLSTKYTEIGVGYAFFNNFGYYVVDFAAP